MVESLKKIIATLNKKDHLMVSSGRKKYTWRICVVFLGFFFRGNVVVPGFYDEEVTLDQNLNPREYSCRH